MILIGDCLCCKIDQDFLAVSLERDAMEVDPFNPKNMDPPVLARFLGSGVWIVGDRPQENDLCAIPFLLRSLQGNRYGSFP